MVSIQNMSQEKYKNGGKGIDINYSFYETAFGKVIIASTNKGICNISFTKNEKEGFLQLKSNFPNAQYTNVKNEIDIFTNDFNSLNEIKLHLKGTPFQIKLWQALLKIPFGQLVTYAAVAKEIKNPKAIRAVGGAIASNTIAFLIPCHRVVLSSGKYGKYRWGSDVKEKIIKWEKGFN